MQDKTINPDEQEFQLLTDPLIYAKIQSLEKKIIDLFGLISEKIKILILNNNFNLTDEIVKSSPKISRGNNYNGFPWTILDYPRIFNKEGVFAIRILCLRGNYFSITLHISGNYFDKYRDKILNASKKLNQGKYDINNTAEEWQHFINSDHYVKIPTDLTEFNELKENLLKFRFIKIAKSFPFSEWNNFAEICNFETNLILSILQ